MELLDLDQKVIYSQIKATLEKYPLLKEIFDEKAIDGIVNDRFRLHRTLIWCLVNDAEYVHDFWKHIVKWLSLLREDNGIEKFKSKLIDPKEFENSILEVEFAGRYKEKGYEVELEPRVLEKKISTDFKLSTDPPIYFECKNISLEFLLQRERLRGELDRIFHRFKNAFEINIDFEKDLKETQLRLLKRRVIQETNNISPDKLPHKFDFCVGESKVAEIEIAKKSIYRFGYLGMVSHPAGFLFEREFEQIRRKVREGLRHLPAAFPGVLILESRHPAISDFLIQNALSGDLKVVVAKERHLRNRLVRGSNRIFRPNQNRRLSAVYFIQRPFGRFSYEMNIYHNPFANKKLTEDPLKTLVEFEELKVHNIYE